MIRSSQYQLGSRDSFPSCGSVHCLSSDYATAPIALPRRSRAQTVTIHAMAGIWQVVSKHGAAKKDLKLATAAPFETLQALVRPAKLSINAHLLHLRASSGGFEASYNYNLQIQLKHCRSNSVNAWHIDADQIRRGTGRLAALVVWSGTR